MQAWNMCLKLCSVEKSKGMRKVPAVSSTIASHMCLVTHANTDIINIQAQDMGLKLITNHNKTVPQVSCITKIHGNVLLLVMAYMMCSNT
jgi:hypothetical protein